MKAIILAAGNGIRMRPLTETLPKPLLTVGNKTILDRLINNFPKEITEIIIVVRYLGEKIKNYVGKEFLGRKVTFIDQPQNINGTFAAIKCCEKLIIKDERFFVFYSDDLISKKTIKECLKYNNAIVASQVAEPKFFGVLQLNDDHTLANIIEKPEKPVTNFVLTNTMILGQKVFKFNPKINPNGEQYLTHALCELASEEKIYVVETKDWLPIGYPEDLKKAEEFLKNKKYK